MCLAGAPLLRQPSSVAALCSRMSGISHIQYIYIYIIGVYPKVVSCLQGDSLLKPAWSQFSFPSLLPAWSFYCTRRLYSSYVSLSRVLVADEAGQEASGDETILGRNRFCLWSASFLWHQLRSCCVCPLTYTHSISSWCMSSAAL